MSGWLYLLQAGELFKIGITSGTVSGRVKQLRTGCPHEINVVCTVALDEVDGAERALHEALHDCREHGEWFRLEPDTLTRVILTMGMFSGAQSYERSGGELPYEVLPYDVGGSWLIGFVDASVQAWARVNGWTSQDGAK